MVTYIFGTSRAVNHPSSLSWRSPRVSRAEGSADSGLRAGEEDGYPTGPGTDRRLCGFVVLWLCGFVVLRWERGFFAGCSQAKKTERKKKRKEKERERVKLLPSPARTGAG